jgi:lysyl-tRNA synthetase class 2
LVAFRRLRGETVLAWLAAGVGLIGLVSGLTPDLSARSDFVRGVLPPGVPEAARVATLAFGIALVILARSLSLRSRRAWQLSVALVIGISLAHLLKALDVEEAALGLVALGLLLRYRRRFDVPGDSAATRPLLATVLALVSATGIALAIEIRMTRIERVADLLLAAALVLAVRAVHLWLRPLTERVLQSVDERRRAVELVREHGHDSLAFFALRRDKNWFFSSTRRSFLAYRVVGGVALVSGDPIGDETEFAELLHEFQRVCRARGWLLALVSVRAELLPVARALGLHSIKIGDEAIVRTSSFSLQGRAVRKVRQSVARLERAGFSVRLVAAADVDEALRGELGRVSDDWRGASAERGFTMAMDDLFREPETIFAVAETRGGVGGFLHLVPSTRGYSLSAMRRDRTSPNGLMEFLIVRAIEWARDRGTSELSLNFCAFADLFGAEHASRWRSGARAALRAADRVFQIERLLVFNRKFHPEWRPRYVCFERFADVPRVGVAYMRAESLLTPPGPWARRAATPTT